MVMLAATCKWFHHVMMEDSVWKYACLRDLQVPDPGNVEFKWIKLYATAFGEPLILFAPPHFDQWKHTVKLCQILNYLISADGSHSYMFHQKEKYIGK